MVLALKRIFKVYTIVGNTFGKWISPVFTGILLVILRVFVSLGRIFDLLLFPSIHTPIQKPILIVGNPRSGTTFLHRYLIKQDLGTGSQLWQMIYPSITIQKIIKPLLPLLEVISPARHHSTEAHKTGLTSIETDDVSLLFRYFDGFFLYGFFLTFDERDLFDWVDPRIRDTSARDFSWFESLWKRNLRSNRGSRYIGKLFSLSGNLPAFQNHFPDAKVLYMLRDPLNVIPSGLSLVTGVLDKKFNFWSLDENIQSRFIERLYSALVELLNRFHDDWIQGKINREKVLVIHYDKMMSDFESLMEEVLTFIDAEPTAEMIQNIRETAESQRQYRSGHRYDLEKFGLSAERIKKDCTRIYQTFLN